MTPYGKIAQYAIAAVSRLAQVYGRNVRLRAAEIAESRDLPQPVVAKVLTVLSQAGLVAGAPGPGGGYALARPPGEITLHDVAQLFERQEDQLHCPFGPNWCGVGDPCPLHEQLARIRDHIDQFLRTNTFASFVGAERTRPGEAALPSPGSVPLEVLGAPGRPRKRAART